MVAHIEGGTRLRVLENRVLRRTFGPRRDEITGEWRKLRIEELNDLKSSTYFSGDQIEKNWMGGAHSTYGARSGVYRVLVGQPEGKRPLGINGRIILRCILRKWDFSTWTGSI